MSNNNDGTRYSLEEGREVRPTPAWLELPKMGEPDTREFDLDGEPELVAIAKNRFVTRKFHKHVIEQGRLTE